MNNLLLTNYLALLKALKILMRHRAFPACCFDG
jgi:hypothetical protein